MATHFLGPVLGRETQSAERGWFSKLPIGFDPNYSIYFNDFIVAQDYAATDWVVTTTEVAGTASEAIAADEKNGALLLTNGTADNDLDALQSLEEFAAMPVGKRLWFSSRMKISDATLSDFFIGLSVTDTTALASADQIGFLKAAASTSVAAVSVKNSTTTSTAGVHTADTNYATYSFYWDGISRAYFYIDGRLVATHASNNPDDENMALTVHIQNGEAAAKTMTIDYFYVCQER